MSYQSSSEDQKRKVAVYGGTFNPFHMGHLLTAQTAGEYFGLDKVLLMPSGASYMKDQRQILDAETRIRLIELSIENNPMLEVSAIETKRAGHTYTCETMRILKQKYPRTEWSFLMGADSMMALSHWKNPEQIMKCCRILVAYRGMEMPDRLTAEADRLRACYGGEIAFLPLRQIDISSTEIRERIAAQKSIRYMVSEKAYEYMMTHHLYEKA